MRHLTMLISSDKAFFLEETHFTGIDVGHIGWIKLKRSDEVSYIAVTIMQNTIYCLRKMCLLHSGELESPRGFQANEEGATLKMEAADSRMFCTCAYASR